MEGCGRVRLFPNMRRLIAEHGVKAPVGFECLLVDNSVAVSHFCHLIGIEVVTMSNSPLIGKLPDDAAELLASSNLSLNLKRHRRFISRANAVIYLEGNPGLCADPEAFVQALFAPYGKRSRSRSLEQEQPSSASESESSAREGEENSSVLGKLVVDAYLNSSQWKRRKQAMDNDILREFERGKAEAYAAGKADGEQELAAARSYLSNIDIILSSEH
jgi:hypothetical protein